jgi:hypothetical protein
MNGPMCLPKRHDEVTTPKDLGTQPHLEMEFSTENDTTKIRSLEWLLTQYDKYFYNRHGNIGRISCGSKVRKLGDPHIRQGMLQNHLNPAEVRTEVRKRGHSYPSASVQLILCLGLLGSNPVNNKLTLCI